MKLIVEYEIKEANPSLEDPVELAELLLDLGAIDYSIEICMARWEDGE